MLDFFLHTSAVCQMCWWFFRDTNSISKKWNEQEKEKENSSSVNILAKSRQIPGRKAELLRVLTQHTVKKCCWEIKLHLAAKSRGQSRNSRKCESSGGWKVCLKSKSSTDLRIKTQSQIFFCAVRTGRRSRGQLSFCMEGVTAWNMIGYTRIKVCNSCHRLG